MKNKSLKIAAIIIAIGIALAIAVNLLLSIQKSPDVTEHDFDFSITYKLDGETQTLNGLYTCRFSGFGRNGIDPLLRYYNGEYTVDGITSPAHSFTIAQNGGYELYIVVLFNEYYLMGDTENASFYPSMQNPHLEATDSDGNAYDETELPGIFDAEIISWEYPEPIENSFHFAGFAGLYSISSAAMLLVGLLTLILCMIFVRKGKGVSYSALDIFGVILNFVSILFVLPVDFFAACLIQAYPIGPAWIYQVYLWIPPIIPLSVAASVSLRRNGYKKSGFYIQFLGVAIMVLVGILEYVI